MKVIAVVSAKGGVGKTTLCANLCIALRLQGHAVLGVDLDPQNALRFHLGLDLQAIEGLSRVTLEGGDPREACVAGNQGVVVLPYGAVNETDRRDFEATLEPDPDWLRRHLEALGLADGTLVVLDTPPGPSVYMKQALRAADLVLVVTLPDAASYATLPIMEGLIDTYCEGRPGFLESAYVINQVNRARQLSKDVTQVMLAHMGDRVVGLVHQDQAVSEALACSQSVLEYDVNAQGTLDFTQLARWVTDRLARSERTR
ncbi:cellulose synthase operon protein YhjQ [Achromobacter sp. GG226]|uniref:cellulose biosynthesis protein BcsQ n=1 Tax=Verticiella alkaliphila TaxID=2779529 RepID=UPI001C0C5CE4|nr:cellulose synthase operon protein YhjQ [Verticiella sp. GG226]